MNLAILNAKQKKRAAQIYKEQRNKVCAFCNKNFIDTSNRLSSQCCSVVCSRKLGVQKRQQNGTYARTPEQNAKMVATLRQRRKDGTLSPEQFDEDMKAKLSRLSKERWKSKAYRKKIKETCIEKYGVEHPMKAPEYKEKMSQLHLGKAVSKETREKLSKNSRKQNHRFSKCRGGIREDLGLYFRSSWEANYARYLNYKNIAWEYEPDTFEIDLGMTYTPDFKITEGNNISYVELKGWETQKYKKKMRAFKKKFSHVRLKVIRKKGYRKLYKKYSEIIVNWEKAAT